MKIVDIKELLGAFDRSKITFLSIEDENGKITLQKDAAKESGSKSIAVGENGMLGEESESGAVMVKSPIVGIAFTAPKPEAEAFVVCGQQIKKGQTLCLVEAMKMFNEVTAPCSGTVKSILFENGTLVEFGTPLFEIDEDAPC